VTLELGSLTYHLTASSEQKIKMSDRWDSADIASAFTAWAKCEKPNCKERFAISGRGGVDDVATGEELDHVEVFEPLSCTPMPHIFNIPAACPKNVGRELIASFELFWLNRAACAGRIRVAIEYLLDHLHIPRRGKNKNGKMYRIDLHLRLQRYKQQRGGVSADDLMAIKWLGNSGSHSDEISRDDLLDGFELLEHALAEILEKRSKKFAALAKGLTKRHAKKR
jgi:hypothetical protein